MAFTLRRFLVLAVLVACFSLACNTDPNPVKKEDVPAQNAKDAKQELDKLQGEWTLVSTEVRGKKRPDTENAVSKLTISENQWVVTYRDFRSNARATIEIDPSKDPKTIDLTLRGEEEPARGIYKLEGDTLTVCYNATVGGERPKEFKTTQETGVLDVLKRAKK
jgi:uncharacterized protein (TIGR03067 family)